MPQVAARGSRR